MIEEGNPVYACISETVLAANGQDADPQHWLKKQDLDRLDPGKLTPITDEVSNECLSGLRDSFSVVYACVRLSYPCHCSVLGN